MTTLLNHEKAVASREAKGLLSEPPAHSCSRRDGINGEATHALGRYLVADDAQDGSLPFCEPRGELRRHRP